MNEKNRSNSSIIWTAVGIAAGVSLLISAFVSVGLNLPHYLSKKPQSVPDLVGLKEKEAETTAERMKFVLIPVGSQMSDFEEGLIAKQYPTPKSKLEQGEEIFVVISSGEPMTRVPELEGLNIAEATDALEEAGLLVSDVVSRNDTLPEDLVIGTDPESGVSAKKATKVTLYVSLGPELIDVPDVTNKSLANARKIIEENGFAVGETKYQVTTEYYQGIIMKQSPAKGDLAPRGSKINLIVAGVLR